MFLVSYESFQQRAKYRQTSNTYFVVYFFKHISSTYPLIYFFLK